MPLTFFLNVLSKVHCRTCLTDCRLGSLRPVLHPALIPQNANTHSDTVEKKNSGIIILFLNIFYPIPSSSQHLLCSVDFGSFSQQLIAFALCAKEWSPEASWGVCLFTIKGLKPFMSLCPIPSLSPENLEEAMQGVGPLVSRTPRDFTFKNYLKYQLLSSYFPFPPMLCQRWKK